MNIQNTYQWIFLVPQGSILGPVLFSAYISTLRLEVLRSIDLIGFADDHVMKKDFLASKCNDEGQYYTSTTGLLYEGKKIGWTIIDLR